NLGMFHYHFKNKDTFIRAVLQRVYEDMFAALSLKVDPRRPVMQSLREAVTLLARFGRDRRALLLRMAADAMAGEAAVAEFFRLNLPRHIAVVVGLVAKGQAAGEIAKAPPAEVTAFLFGAVGAPVLIGAALQQHVAGPSVAEIERRVLSDSAIDRRLDFALRGLAPDEGAPS
ncbi:MAG: TetR/AcrR family transcriptional regulator, partial [Rhizobacter sp.]|nr:TetR/AcrR family transcriptional regulator [Rhizobacter sp.]